VFVYHLLTFSHDSSRAHVRAGTPWHVARPRYAHPFLAHELVFTHQAIAHFGHIGQAFDGFVRKDGLTYKDPVLSATLGSDQCTGAARITTCRS